jgi:ABC-type sulfate/molybdate transport systems ATPase subunit
VFGFLGEANWLATTVDGRRATVGFRPDDLEISLGPLEGHSFAARVRRVHSFGPRAKLELVSATGSAIQADVPAERVRSLSLSPGAEIYAAPRELQVFFDDVQSAS